MDSSLPPSMPPLPTLTTDRLRAAWNEYEQTLASLPGTPVERMQTLHGLLADVSARLETESRALVSRTLSDYARSQDSAQSRRSSTSTPPAPPRPEARGQSPQPSPLDLLARSERIGPRLAQKLILASARASARR